VLGDDFGFSGVSVLVEGVGIKSAKCWEAGKFPLETSNFSIFSIRVKKLSSCRVKKYPGQRNVGLLFTAGQK